MGDENGVIRKEEKREAKEKISGCSEGGYGESWCKEEGHLKQDAVEEHHSLWLTLIKEKEDRNHLTEKIITQKNEIKLCLKSKASSECTVKRVL